MSETAREDFQQRVDANVLDYLKRSSDVILRFIELDGQSTGRVDVSFDCHIEIAKMIQGEENGE